MNFPEHTKLRYPAAKGIGRNRHRTYKRTWMVEFNFGQLATSSSQGQMVTNLAMKTTILYTLQFGENRQGQSMCG